MSILNLTESKPSSVYQRGAQFSMTRDWGSATLQQDVTFTATAGASNAMLLDGNVRMVADAACRVRKNSEPTNTQGTLLPANSPEWMDVKIGDIIHVIAVA